MPGIVPSMHGVNPCPKCGADCNEYPCTCNDPPMSPWEKSRSNAVRQARAYEAAKEFAVKQGLSLIQLTPRRYIVINFNSAISLGPATIARKIYFLGQKVFGPDTHENCKNYLTNEACQEVPMELSKALAD